MRKKQREPGYVPTGLDLYKSISLRTLVAYVVLAIVGGIAAYAAGGEPTLWGVLLGIGIAGVAMGLTLTVMILTEKNPRINDMAVMLGGYLFKIIALFVVFVALQGFSFFSEIALFLGFGAAIIVSLIVDTWTIATTRA